MVANQYAAQLMASTDENRDGNISLEEWMAFFDRVWTDDVSSEHVDETMRSVRHCNNATNTRADNHANTAHP